MERRLVIDGNAVYEIDEQCMLKKHSEESQRREAADRENRKSSGNQAESCRRKRTE